MPPAGRSLLDCYTIYTFHSNELFQVLLHFRLCCLCCVSNKGRVVLGATYNFNNESMRRNQSETFLLTDLRTKQPKKCQRADAQHPTKIWIPGVACLTKTRIIPGRRWTSLQRERASLRRACTRSTLYRFVASAMVVSIHTSEKHFKSCILRSSTHGCIFHVQGAARWDSTRRNKICQERHDGGSGTSKPQKDKVVAR